jgi:hypothetical protein
MGKIPKKAKRITEKFTEAVAEAIVEHFKTACVDQHECPGDNELP